MRSCVVFRQMTYCIRILLGLNASEQRMMCDVVDQFSVTALKVDVRSSYDRRPWLDQFWQGNFGVSLKKETKLSRKRGEMKAIQRQRGHHKKASKSVSRGSHSPFKQIVYTKADLSRAANMVEGRTLFACLRFERRSSCSYVTNRRTAAAARFRVDWQLPPRPPLQLWALSTSHPICLIDCARPRRAPLPGLIYPAGTGAERLDLVKKQ